MDAAQQVCVAVGQQDLLLLEQQLAQGPHQHA
jgi:hypothetical protein